MKRTKIKIRTHEGYTIILGGGNNLIARVAVIGCNGERFECVLNDAEAKIIAVALKEFSKS